MFFRIIAVIILAVLVISVFSFRYPLKYLDIIVKNTDIYGLDPALICAVIHAESKFAEEAVSRKGASGLMQITESTGDWMAEQMGLPDYSFDEIFEPSLNISIGCRYLSWLLNRYESVDSAVAAYNAGSGNVDKWLKNPMYSADGKNLDNIPFKETRDYVRRVRVNKLIYDFILHNKGSKKLFGEN
ncbi:MAG: lytic transglycosylase domain-containing protein [Clostridiales bacterium]|nr:lytic transglycosylase domain-containing protein [Clostridiales bacterium]